MFLYALNSTGLFWEYVPASFSKSVSLVTNWLQPMAQEQRRHQENSIRFRNVKSTEHNPVLTCTK
jgi:hypothetical protein